MAEDFKLEDELLTGLFNEALAQSSRSESFPLPDWFDDDFPYEPHDFVGRGGSGFVWKARHRSSGEWVALKVIVFQGDVLSGRERWLREARIAGSVKHEHLIGIHDSGLAPDGISGWLALEWIEGSDLHQHFRQNALLSWDDLAPMVQQICQGLGALHQGGLIHRDLKPSNLLLSLIHI